MSGPSDKQDVQPIEAMATAKDQRQPVIRVTTTAIRSAQETDVLEVLLHVEAPREVAQRAPVDLVAVLDVSGSMKRPPERDDNSALREGEESRLHHLQTAMTFVVDMLVDGDRLALVPFSDHVHSDSSGIRFQKILGNADRQKAREIVNQLQAKGSTGFTPALRKAVEVLESRGEEDKRKRRGFIIFLSDGVDNPEFSEGTNWDEVSGNPEHQLRATLGMYQIDTFGFSKFHEPTSLLTIAQASRGAYSFLFQGLDKMKEAFAVCLGGISWVVAVVMRIDLKATEGVEIMSIESGGYRSQVHPGKASGHIEIPVLYAGETKNFIVRLRSTPPVGKRVLLSAGGYFQDATDNSKNVTVVGGELQSDAVDAGGDSRRVVLGEMARFKLLSVLERLREQMARDQLPQGRFAEELKRMWDDEKNSFRSYGGDVAERFDGDVTKMVGNMNMQSLPGRARLAYTWSWVSSHQMERATAMGEPGKVAQEYETLHMKNMAEMARQPPPGGHPISPSLPDTVFVPPPDPGTDFVPPPDEAPKEDDHVVAAPSAVDEGEEDDAPADADPAPAPVPAANDGGGEDNAGEAASGAVPEDGPAPCKCVEYSYVAEQHLAYWSNVKRDLLSMLPQEHPECPRGHLLATLSLQSINRAMYESVFLAVEHVCHLRACYRTAAMGKHVIDDGGDITPSSVGSVDQGI